MTGQPSPGGTQSIIANLLRIGGLILAMWQGVGVYAIAATPDPYVLGLSAAMMGLAQALHKGGRK